jgi:hypothetical protein
LETIVCEITSEHLSSGRSLFFLRYYRKPVFGSGFRAPVAAREPSATPMPTPAAAPARRTIWILEVDGAASPWHRAVYAAESREILETVAAARGYTKDQCDYIRYNVLADVWAADLGPRALGIRRLNLPTHHVVRGRGRNLAHEAWYAGYQTLGAVADAGVDGLRALKLPAPIIRQVAETLARHGLKLRPAAKADAA